MIDYMESIETAVLKGFEKGNSFVERNSPLSPGDVLWKKAKGKPRWKNKIPLCNWTMPAQPEGYIRAGKYDLL